MFRGLGQCSVYSDLLWASLGCGICHPPLSSAEVKESIELYLYSPLNACFRINLFFLFLIVYLFGDRVAWSVLQQFH